MGEGIRCYVCGVEVTEENSSGYNRGGTPQSLCKRCSGLLVVIRYDLTIEEEQLDQKSKRSARLVKERQSQNKHRENQIKKHKRKIRESKEAIKKYEELIKNSKMSVVKHQKLQKVHETVLKSRIGSDFRSVTELAREVVG
jgi:hypothetical protein